MTVSNALSAFVAQSFSPCDEDVNRQIRDFLKSAEVPSETGEEAENRQVSAKIRERIDSHPIFVGIVTRRSAIEPELARSRYFLARIFGSAPTSYSTSAWVIQETGYALGKDRKLILIVEPGVEIPQLQSDLEYVTLHRDSLFKTFQRLNEVITNIKATQRGGLVHPTAVAAAQEGEADTRISPPMNASSAAETGEASSETPDARSEALKALVEATFEAQNLEEMEVAYARLEASAEASERPRWKAFYLRHRFLLGDGSAFPQLELLTAASPEDAVVHQQMALALETVKAWHRASAEYQRASELAGTAPQKARFLVSSTRCLSRAGESLRAIELIKDALLHATESQVKGILISGLSQAAADAGDIAASVRFSESSLLEAPTDTELRFRLAYSYSETDEDSLSLYHYRILEATQPGGTTLNNLGVALSRLGLLCKGVAAFKAAAAKGETLAMANLADKYRAGGFAEDAADMIGRALGAADLREVHGNVGKAKDELAVALDAEDKREGQLLAEAEKTREFRVQVAKALLDCGPATLSVAGEWTWDEWTSLTIQQAGDALIGVFRKQTKALIPSTLGGYGARTEVTSTLVVTLTGSLDGRTSRMAYETAVEGGYAKWNEQSGSLEVIFQPDGSGGYVRQESSAKAVKYYRVQRAQTAQA
jgi:tetratricopeptide (TPR) repeat protein